MLTLEHMNELAGTMIANGIASLEVKGNDYALRLERSPDAASITADAPGLDLMTALSPADGVFHPRGEADGLPVLHSGAQVVEGEPLGYIGIGPVRFLCVSPTSGQVIGTLPVKGITVSAGDPLFTVEPRS